MGKIAIKTNATADISSILPEVLRFYDATATSTITLASGTNNITSWGDRSVNNIAATQTVGNEQPIYDSINKTINMSPIRNFSINFGTNAFSGTVYIADADHGVLDFAISVGANTILNVWTKANFQPRTSNAFLKVIGIVITSNPNHRSIIENYFGSKSQNLKYSNATSLQDFWITESNNSFFACRVSSFPLLNTQNVTSIVNAWYQCTSLTSFPALNTQNVTSMQQAWFQCTSLTSFPLLNTQNVTSMYAAWLQCTSLTSFPALNTQNVTSMQQAWFQCTSLTSFPLLNTQNVTSMHGAWYQCYSLTLFPLLNTQNVIDMYAAFRQNTNLTSFPPLNTQKVTDMSYILYACGSLTSFPSLNTRDVTNISLAWASCPLTSLSLDNILISIAAGFANNLSKSIHVGDTFLSTPAILSHQNRRPTTNNPEDTQDTISNWNTIIDSYLSNQITLTEMRNQHANAIDTYNTKWKSWEQALRNTNESLNGVQYNFSNGTVSGQKARFWILAKKSLDIPSEAPTTLTTGVTRSYRSNSGLTVSGSNVNAWTPVTGTSNQTISGLTTQTINGITCVMFSSTKTITLNSISVTNTGNFVYIGTLYGYVKITPPTATNLRISTNSTTELPIISIMVTTTAVNETEVLLRLGFYGSFQEFNYTANTLTSANIQLTAV